MKFLADMGVSPRCVEWLRTQGYDAVHLYEQKLHKLPDSEILLKAKNEKRILLTMDLDFSWLLSKVISDDSPTVVIFRVSDQRPLNIQTRLITILPIIRECFEEGSFILSVSDSKVRIRHLPIK
jgi:predicted nuclease of predicted toxin-antitoxin system